MISPPSGYVLHEEIGRGSTARVYRGHHRALDRPVALKRIPTEGLDSHQQLRIRREGQSLARTDSPYIVRVYDVALTGDAIWLITEFVPGRSLQQIRDSGRRPDLATSLTWSAQLADALVALEQIRLVHRDLKPANIIVTDQATCRVIDFGTAAAASSTGGGTPAFMSPEQVAGRSLNHKSDIYAVGLIIYQLITGRHAFESETGDPVRMMRAQLTKTPADPRIENPAVSARLQRIVAATLRKHPCVRPSPTRLRRQLKAELG